MLCFFLFVSGLENWQPARYRYILLGWQSALKCMTLNAFRLGMHFPVPLQYCHLCCLTPGTHIFTLPSYSHGHPNQQPHPLALHVRKDTQLTTSPGITCFFFFFKLNSSFIPSICSTYFVAQRLKMVTYLGFLSHTITLCPVQPFCSCIPLCLTLILLSLPF